MDDAAPWDIDLRRYRLVMRLSDGYEPEPLAPEVLASFLVTPRSPDGAAPVSMEAGCLVHTPRYSWTRGKLHWARSADLTWCGLSMRRYQMARAGTGFIPPYGVCDRCEQARGRMQAVEDGAAHE